MTTAEIYDTPEFQEWAEVVKRAANIRLTLEESKKWVAELQEKLAETE